MLAQQDQAENSSHNWSHVSEKGKDKMEQLFQYYLGFFFLFFSFQLTVSGISPFSDFMGVTKHCKENPLWRSDFVKARLPVAI